MPTRIAAHLNKQTKIPQLKKLNSKQKSQEVGRRSTALKHSHRSELTSEGSPEQRLKDELGRDQRQKSVPPSPSTHGFGEWAAWRFSMENPRSFPVTKHCSSVTYTKKHLLLSASAASHLGETSTEKVNIQWVPTMSHSKPQGFIDSLSNIKLEMFYFFKHSLFYYSLLL